MDSGYQFGSGDMSNWFDRGCAACREDALSGKRTVLARLAETGDWSHLYRCQSCGSYWEETQREMHVIEHDEAKRAYPGAFAS